MYLIILIYNYLKFNLYSSNDNIKIISDFVEYFNFNLYSVKLTAEGEYILKFYISLFLLFLQYIKNPNEKLTLFWCQILKPFLNEYFPITKVGIYNTNADIKILITQIDEIITKSQIKEKCNFNDINNEININNSRPHSKTFLKESLRKSNKNKINLSDNKKNNSFHSNNDIILENEIEKNIEDKLNGEGSIKKNNIQLVNNNNNIKSKSEINNCNNNDNNPKIKNIRESNKMSKSKSVNIFKEMKPNYLDKEETEKKNIEYDLNHKKIKLIDIDLLLKKIAENSLTEENLEVLYYFIKQSFSFLKQEIFIKKFIKCYEYHKAKEENLSSKIENLVEFFNAYVIEYMVYNKDIINDEKILELINSFYSKLKSDIILLNQNKKMIGISKNKKIREKILEEKICTKIKDKNNETIKPWTKELVKKKIKNYFKLNRLRYELIQKEKISFLGEAKVVSNKLIKKINSQDNLIIKENKSAEQSRKSSVLSLSMDKTPKSDKKLINISNKKKMPRSSTRDSILIKNDGEINKKENIINDDFIVDLVGKKYESTIKNTELIISKEEYFLSSLRNITNLINTKLYSETEILNIKRESKIRNKTLIKKNDILCYKFKIINESMNSQNTSSKKYFCVTDYKIEQIGEVLISVSKKSLNSVEYKELYCAIFTKNQKNIKSPHIMDNIKKFNNLIFFIVEDILSYDTPKERAKMIDQWALIAKYCKKRKDQSDCLAINSALNHYIITGLKQTFDLIKHSTKNILKEIGEYCSLKGNYKVFRDEVINSKNDEFYLPYLGYIMRDINFFEEKGKYMVQGIMVNFEKIENVQKTLDTFFRFKHCFDRIKIEGVNELNFFENLEEKNEQELEKIADNLEPEFKLEKQNNDNCNKRLTSIDINYFGNKIAKNNNKK